MLGDVNDHFRFNTAISALMELSNMMAPFAEEDLAAGSPQRPALLRFAFLWLRFSLFGEQTVKVKADVAEAFKGKLDKKQLFDKTGK